jgi:RNA binding exosome subunit
MTEMNELYEIQNLIYEAKSIDSTEINSRLLKLEKKILSLENTFNQLKNTNINNDFDDKIKINELSNKEILSKLNDIDLELGTTFCTQSIDETIKLYAEFKKQLQILEKTNQSNEELFKLNIEYV